MVLIIIVIIMESSYILGYYYIIHVGIINLKDSQTYNNYVAISLDVTL